MSNAPLAPQYIQQADGIARLVFFHIASLPPKQQLRFLTFMLMQVAGNLPRPVWQALNVRPEPCGKPGCTCESGLEAVLDCLSELRDCHGRVIARATPNG